MAVSKIITLTSTYDHRVIQGAQSGEFLKVMHELLLGEHGFYDEIFTALRIPYEPVRWVRDIAHTSEGQIDKTARVIELIREYRVRGHLMADTDPLEFEIRKHPDLDIREHGLTLWDLDRTFPVGGFAGKDEMKLRDILGVLRDSYCRRVGVEYMHIQDPEERHWIQERVERKYAKPTPEEQQHILGRLNAAEAFETFLATKYVGQKRFSLEGGESLIPLLDEVLQASAEGGLDEVVIGMAHRGRLNVLANIVGKPYEKIFSEFEGHLDPKTAQGSGDVKYHLGMTGKFTTPDGQFVTTVSLTANPSHLEAVDPVLEGIVRAKQDRLDLGLTGYTVLPLLMHGDAAFAGQGVVAETLNLSQLRGYRTGGTVHVVVNNQVGFTTAPEYSRSSLYCTDVARMIQAPIFHVNGDDPESVVRVARLAFEYRQEFNKDVVIDLVCYRRRGHNEGDDPSMTNPLMYQIIDAKRSVRKLYTEELIGRGDITVEQAEEALRDYQTPAGDGLQGDPRRGRRGVQPAHPGQGGAARADRGHRDPGRPGPPHRRGAHRAARRASPRTSASSSCWTGAPRWPSRATSTGASARSSRSARCWPRASPYGCPARTRGAAPSCSGTPPSSTPTPAPTSCRTAAWPPDDARFHAQDSLLSRVRRARLRVRLLRRGPQRAGAVGGAVRRLRQRRPVGHRRVHLLRRGQVGPAVQRHDAAAARPRGPGPRPHLGPPGALAAAGRRGQHAHRRSRRPRPTTSTCCAARRCRPSASRWWSSRRSRCCGTSFACRRWPTSPTAPSSRSSARPRSSTRRGVKRVLLCSGKVYYDLVQARRRARHHRHRDHPPGAALPAAGRRGQGRAGQVPDAEDFSWVQEEPANQGAWSFVALNLLEHLDGVRLRRISRPAAAAPAVGSTKLHDVEQAALLEAALPKA